MHRAHQARELGLGLALRAERDDEAGGLHVGDAPFEDLAERGRDVVLRERGAAHEPGKDRRQDLVHAVGTALSPTTGRDRGRRGR